MHPADRALRLLDALAAKGVFVGEDGQGYCGPGDRRAETVFVRELEKLIRQVEAEAADAHTETLRKRSSL